MRLEFLNRFGQTRRLLRTLERIASAQEAQSRHLQRIGDYLVGPEVLPASEEDLKVHSGVSFSTDQEQARILDTIDRFRRASGRDPSEDELLELLEVQQQWMPMNEPVRRG